MVDTGALAEVERLIAAGTERALDALDTAEVAPPAGQVLRELAAAATARRHAPALARSARTVVAGRAVPERRRGGDGDRAHRDGPTDRVVVVGAGLGGLSAALRLAGAGREVTVLEREPVPGGRAGRLELDGYAFDTGPTVLTMPDLIADALDSVGERLEDWLDLRPVDPLYRAHYPDGSTLDVHADVDAMAAEVERVCGPGEAAGYRRFVDVRVRALPGRDAQLHRPQHRLAARPARPGPGPAGRAARLPPAGAPRWRGT